MDAVTLLRSAQTFLESIHPVVPWGLLTGCVWFLVYAVRRWTPAAWTAMESFGPASAPASGVFQALPGVLAGSLAGVFLTGGDYHQAWKGAAAGALAPLVHHVLKALPVPYRGGAGRGE